MLGLEEADTQPTDVSKAELKIMLRECIRELRALGAHTVPTRAENLLRQDRK